MILERFSFYLTNEMGYKDEWCLKDICLNNLNLIVGKNSTGKSRALRVVKVFAKAITGGGFVKAYFIFNYKRNENESLVYEVIFGSKTFISEKITLKNELDNNESILLNRTDEVAQIYSYIEKRIQTIHPPKNKLTLHVRRDVGEYPYFEDIVNWAESLQFFNFGHIHASTSFDNSNSDKERTYSSNLSIAEMVQELSDDSKSKVINTFNEFGYELTDIAPSLLKDKKEIVIKEKNMQGDILETAISQGMFRALSLLVFIQYMIDKKIITTLVIDDLCEGLDYERSSKLGRKIFDILKENDIQTIATTNDYFLMNSIDIDYWNILRRNNSVVKAYNKSSNLELFKKFDFSGLMNFDLFSSNFIAKELGDE